MKSSIGAPSEEGGQTLTLGYFLTPVPNNQENDIIEQSIPGRSSQLTKSIDEEVEEGSWADKNKNKIVNNHNESIKQSPIQEHIKVVEVKR